MSALMICYCVQQGVHESVSMLGDVVAAYDRLRGESAADHGRRPVAVLCTDQTSVRMRGQTYSFDKHAYNIEQKAVAETGLAQN